MHRCSVFTNSCLRVPVDPLSKMPNTAYERREKNILNEQLSIDSSTTVSMSGEDLDSKKLKDFYRSIPDYSDINHLPASEFYSTLRSLREKKKIMLGHAIEHIDHDKTFDDQDLDSIIKSPQLHNIKKDMKVPQRRKFSLETGRGSIMQNNTKKSCENLTKNHNKTKTLIDPKNTYAVEVKSCENEQIKPKTIQSSLIVTGTSKTDRPKRNHSACSITWHDDKIERKNEIDEKFDKFFDRVGNFNVSNDGSEYQTQSMPTSPLRTRKTRPKYKNITIPKPFKMTERDEEERIVNELRTIQKSFSDDMLNQKLERKPFKARPVPVESRIPLYDKILEDQAMRRAVSKINSEAELRARMKPFSFTKREENGSDNTCERAQHILPKSKKKRRFKARPVPKNLFSNYFYDKSRENNFFRSMNRRIRAEEMLRNASFPGNMAMRERSRLSTPAAHSDLPIDPSLAGASVSSADNLRSISPTKGFRKSSKNAKDNFITTSPQPFRFNTADRANKKMQDIQKKVCQGSNCSESSVHHGISETTKAYSALDLNSIAVGRSNLAALLRAEAVRRKFEQEADRRLSEQRRKTESKYRDRQLRSKPAWHLVKNNHEEDIAMRLQTRKDEERLRKEEFLHEMELMYGRVQQQPLLFERYYAPRPPNTEIDFSQLLSPRKSPKKKNLRKKKMCSIVTPSRSSDYQDDAYNYLGKIDKNDKFYQDLDII
ncbi:protein FAM161A isoform X2 [Colias croceus]|uniref:protein FAM161A isoform X2 n=1 Tax=Colias crocea TaxID=72248 RepID=UPI001E27FF47|nr:protein FAM161A isoform X2 [Colias croceus]